MKQILEHINLSVPSIAATEAFLLAALPEYRRRGEGSDPRFGPWVHIGDETSYISLTEMAGAPYPESFSHAGFCVADIGALRARLAEAGYQPSDEHAMQGHPYRQRIYFIDGNGLEWEFVQYLSADDGERNDYSH